MTKSPPSPPSCSVRTSQGSDGGVSFPFFLPRLEAVACLALALQFGVRGGRA